MTGTTPPAGWRRFLILAVARLLPRRHRDAFIGDMTELWEGWQREGRGGTSRRLVAELLRGAAGSMVQGVRARHERRVVESWENGHGTNGSVGMVRRLLSDLRGDIKVAFRRMRRSPGFTFLAVLSIALGVGANAALFTLIDELLLRPPPYHEPERLVNVRLIEPGDAFGTVSYIGFREFEEATREAYESVTAVMFNMVGRTDGDGPARNLVNELVAGPFFQVLGVDAQLGRVFDPSEGHDPGADPVVVVSDRYWRTAMGGDPAVVGTTIRLNGHPYTVVGVAAPDFDGLMPGLPADVWAHASMSGQISLNGPGALEDRGQESFLMKGRLADGVTLAQAQTVTAGFGEELAQRFPDRYQDNTFSVTPELDSRLHPALDGVVVPMAALIMAVVGLVLLIACVNLAGFLLARAEGLRREVAVRLALGAGRARLVRGLLTETGVLAAVAGAVGVVLSVFLVDLMLSIRLPLPIPVTVEAEVNLRVLLFGLAATAMAGLILGLVPALQSTGGDVAGTIRDESTGGSGRGIRLRDVLVVGQVAGSVVLLVGAGLFIRSLLASQAVDPGFGGEPAAILPLEVPPDRTAEERRTFFEELQERVSLMPGVEGVGLISRIHLDATGTSSSSIRVDGVDPPPGRTTHSLDIAQVDGDIFGVLGIPIVSGRAFTQADNEDSDPVAIVSEAMAERFWPGVDPVGKTFTNAGAQAETEVRVVGVARDTKVHRLGEGPTPLLYRPAAQTDYWGRLVATTSGDPRALLPRLIALAKEIEPAAIVFNSTTMAEHLGFMLLPARISAFMLGLMGGLAAFLAAIGLYGIMAYSVAARSREMGIRMSVGAEPGRLVAMVMRSGMKRVGLGIVIGLGLALPAAQVVRGSLYGVGALDPLTFGSVAVLLTLVAALAAYLPARRASRVDPTHALKAE